MPFRADPGLATATYAGTADTTKPFLSNEYLYGGKVPSSFRPDASLDAYNVNPMLQTLGRIGYSIIDPAVEYAKSGIEAGYQLGRGAYNYATNPLYRSARNKSETGQELTQAEAKATLGSGPEWLFKTSARDFTLKKPEDKKKIYMNMAKRTAGMEAYVAPGLIATPGIAAGMGAHVLAGAGRGAISGGLMGFAQSKEGEELKNTLMGTGTGAAVGAAFGYMGGRSADKIRKAQAEANRIMLEKELVPASKTAGKTFGSMLKFSSRKATKDINVGEASQKLIDMGMGPQNNMDEMAARLQLVTGRQNELGGRNGILTEMVDEALDGADDLVQVDDVASNLGKVLDTSIDIDDQQVNKAMQQILKVTPQAKMDNTFSRALRNAGFGQGDVDDALAAIRNTPNWAHWKSTLINEGFPEEQAQKIVDLAGQFQMTQPTVGQAQAIDVMKLNRVLEAKAREYNREAILTGSERAATLRNAYTQASSVLDDRLDNLIGNRQRLMESFTPERQAAMNEAFPGNEFIKPLGDQVGDLIEQGATVGKIRNLQRAPVQILRAIYETERAPQLLENSAAQLSARLAAAGLGLYAGSPIAAIIGYTAAPVMGPALGAIQERATTPISTRAGLLLNQLAAGGLKANVLRSTAGARDIIRRSIFENPYLLTPGMLAGQEILQGPPPQKPLTPYRIPQAGTQLPQVQGIPQR